MGDESLGYRMVVCNCPPGKARAIGEPLVRERLAACVNMIPGVQSIYAWKGEICQDGETTLLIKTRAELLPALTKRIVELHPYDVPEIVALPLVAGEGEARYFAWIDEVTG